MKTEKYKLSDVLAARTNDKMLKDCSKELQEMFDECPTDETLQLVCGKWYSGNKGVSLQSIYRISDNWPPAEEIEDDTVRKRWFFHPADKKVITVIDEEEVEAYQEVGQGFIEITAAQAEYLRNKPKAVEGFEWVRKVAF